MEKYLLALKSVRHSLLDNAAFSVHIIKNSVIAFKIGIPPSSSSVIYHLGKHFHFPYHQKPFFDVALLPILSIQLHQAHFGLLLAIINDNHYKWIQYATAYQACSEHVEEMHARFFPEDYALPAFVVCRTSVPYSQHKTFIKISSQCTLAFFPSK